jgi:hypothetical protein
MSIDWKYLNRTKCLTKILNTDPVETVTKEKYLKMKQKYKDVTKELKDAKVKIQKYQKYVKAVKERQKEEWYDFCNRDSRKNVKRKNGMIFVIEIHDLDRDLIRTIDIHDIHILLLNDKLVTAMVN